MTEPLSEEYLKNRGFCCGCGCTNCPYYPKHYTGSKILRKEVIKKREEIISSEA